MVCSKSYDATMAQVWAKSEQLAIRLQDAAVCCFKAAEITEDEQTPMSVRIDLMGSVSDDTRNLRSNCYVYVCVRQQIAQSENQLTFVTFHHVGSNVTFYFF